MAYLCKYCGEGDDYLPLLTTDETQKLRIEVGLSVPYYDDELPKIEADLLYAWDEMDTFNAPINYCPICGRVLNKSGARQINIDKAAEEILDYITLYRSKPCPIENVYSIAHKFNLTKQEYYDLIQKLQEEGKAEIERDFILPVSE